MLRPLFAPALVLLGCASERPRRDCAVEDNALRIVCRFELSHPAEATLTWAADGEPPRTETATGARLTFTLWDLPPDTDVEWTLTWQGPAGGAQERRGTARTDPLPPEVAVTFTDLVPGPDAIDRLLFVSACPAPTDGGGVIVGNRQLVVSDRNGVVRWYAPSPVGGDVRAYDASEDGSMWMLVERRTLHEVALDGTPLHTLRHPTDYPYIGHHDVTSRYGQTLLVHARTEEIGPATWVVDGLTEIRDGEAEPIFSVSEVIEPRLTSFELPGYWGASSGVQGIDFGHANSIDVDPAGRWLMSFKHLDTIFAFEGHPDRADRGALSFSLVGGNRGLDGGDYTLVDSDGVRLEGFEYPHHARWIGENQVSVFDNGRVAPEGERQATSRALVIELDDGQAIARVVRDLDLGSFCRIQGSAYNLADGSMLVYCHTNTQFWVFDDDDRVQRRSQIACADGSESVRFARIVPLDLDYRPIPPR